jgi:hypothetical protein
LGVSRLSENVLPQFVTFSRTSYYIADEYGFGVIFLPPYSPDLNPIEKFWANVKRRL